MEYKVISMCILFSNIGLFYGLPNDLPHEPVAEIEEDSQYWINLGQTKLQEALDIELNENVAKNVIFFLGDGMSLPTVTAARILKGQRQGNTGEEGFMEFEKFPYSGLVKTYCINYQVPDSASTATALLTGVKTDYMVVGLDGSAVVMNCSSMTNNNILSGMATWSQAQGKRTGIVTSTRVTHASPACVYAHSPYRFWECDADLTENVVRNCPDFKDIARQLIEDEPGSNFNVIMGGGLSYLDGNVTDTPLDPADGCIRKDGLNLWRYWLENKQTTNINSHFVQTRSQLNSLDLVSTDNLMGIFANDHLPYEYMKRENNLDIPTLAEMVESAIGVLDKGDNGYFLFVEGGRIDMAHHANRAHTALDETIAFSDAVAVAVNMSNSENTLIVVTADHSHTMSFSGYPKRGNSIIGVAGEDDSDIGYTSLQYANGPSYNLSIVNDTISRPDPRDEDTASYEYRQQSMDPLSSETHAGDDVPIYANGPMAHLLQGVIEQNFVAHAMSYASCVGLNLNHCSNSNVQI